MDVHRRGVFPLGLGSAAPRGEVCITARGSIRHGAVWTGRRTVRNRCGKWSKDKRGAGTRKETSRVQELALGLAQRSRRASRGGLGQRRDSIRRTTYEFIESRGAGYAVPHSCLGTVRLAHSSPSRLLGIASHRIALDRPTPVYSRPCACICRKKRAQTSVIRSPSHRGRSPAVRFTATRQLAFKFVPSSLFPASFTLGGSMTAGPARPPSTLPAQPLSASSHLASGTPHLAPVLAPVLAPDLDLDPGSKCWIYSNSNSHSHFPPYSHSRSRPEHTSAGVHYAPLLPANQFSHTSFPPFALRLFHTVPLFCPLSACSLAPSTLL